MKKTFSLIFALILTFCFMAVTFASPPAKQQSQKQNIFVAPDAAVSQGFSQSAASRSFRSSFSPPDIKAQSVFNRIKHKPTTYGRIVKNTIFYPLE